MKINRTGATRWVLLTRSYAFKVPALRSWRNFLQGLLANMQEHVFYRAGWPELCPITFALPGGFLVVMPRCQELTEEEFARMDYEAMTDFPDRRVPAEAKASSWGWLNGRVVAFDYGS